MEEKNSNRLLNERTDLKAVLSLVSILIILVSNYIQVMVLAFILEFILLTFYGKFNPLMVIKKLKLPLIYIFIAIIPLGISLTFSPFKLYFAMGEREILTAMRCLSCVFWLMFLNLTTTPSQLNFFFRKIHVPDFLLELMHLTVRFIQITDETAREMITAQQSRGGYRGFKNTIKSIGILMSNLFVKSLKKTTEISYAIDSRSYGQYRTVSSKKGSFSFKVITILIPTTLIIFLLYLNYWR